MTPGDIIAFEAKESRRTRHGDRPLFDGEELEIWIGKPDDHRVRTFRPIPSPEIAEAQRVLAAVARHRPTIEALAENRVTFTDDLLKMAKEILGS